LPEARLLPFLEAAVREALEPLDEDGRDFEPEGRFEPLAEALEPEAFEPLVEAVLFVLEARPDF
jgi:hypothetical protein